MIKSALDKRYTNTVPFLWYRTIPSTPNGGTNVRYDSYRDHHCSAQGYC